MLFILICYRATLCAHLCLAKTFAAAKVQQKNDIRKKNGIFLEIPDNPERCANPGGGAKRRRDISYCFFKSLMKPSILTSVTCCITTICANSPPKDSS